MHSDAGQSAIVCGESSTVFEDMVLFTAPLAVDAVITCSGTHVLTAADVDNLERTTIGTATAKDEYDYKVEASSSETVSLSQVRSSNLPVYSGVYACITLIILFCCIVCPFLFRDHNICRDKIARVPLVSQVSSTFVPEAEEGKRAKQKSIATNILTMFEPLQELQFTLKKHISKFYFFVLREPNVDSQVAGSL